MLHGISTNLTANTADFFSGFINVCEFITFTVIRSTNVYTDQLIRENLFVEIKYSLQILDLNYLDTQVQQQTSMQHLVHLVCSQNQPYNGIIFRKIIFQIDLVFKIVIVSENECFIYIARMHPKTITRLQLTMLKFNNGCCHGNLPKLAIIGAAASMSRDLLELLVRELENI